jgi:hypothetical protein
MSIRKFSRLAAVAIFLLASRAQAVPLFVDFTSASNWGSAEGQTSHTSTYGSVDVTLSVLSGSALSFNAGTAAASTAHTNHLALDGDGIGIGNDEIGAGEQLKVTFSSPVTVLSLELLDLFPNEGTGGASEQFLADFGAAGTLSGSALGVDPSGYYANLGLNFAGVSSFSLSSLGGSWSDFALAGIWVDDGLLSVFNAVSVIEPGILLLLGTGLFIIGASGLRRRPASR